MTGEQQARQAAIYEARADACKFISRAYQTSNPGGWLEEEVLRAGEELKYTRRSQLETYWQQYLTVVDAALKEFRRL